MPRFSVIVPCFDAEATLGETLDAIRAQTCPDWECLLIDDGSRDATPGLIAAAALADPRIRALRNPAKGPSAARNLALTEARGEIIAFCDADDTWMPEKLARLAAAFDGDPALAGAYGQIAFFGEGRTRTRSRVPAGDLSVGQLLGENPVCTMSNMALRAEVFRASGGFDTTMVHNEDLEWLVRLVGSGYRVAGVDAHLVNYRTSRRGLSSDLAAMAEGRARAVESAARFGHRPGPRAEAIHLRYLARRALRVDAPAREAVRLALAGIATSPAGFFSDPHRGVLTVAAALAAPILPRALRAALFTA